MKTAFDSSIAGVVAYLILLLGHAIAIKGIREEQARCISVVNEISVLDSVEQKLLGLDGQAFSEAAKKTAEAAAALNSASQAADTSALAMKRSAEQLSAEAIGNAVGEQIRLVLTEQFMPVLEGMQASLEGWNALRESVIEPMAEHVESLDGSVESLVESVEKVIGEIAGLKDANQKLAISIDSLNRLVKDDLGTAADLLNRAMREFSGAANDAAKEFNRQWSDALSSSVAGLTELSTTFEKIHDAVKVSYNYTKNTTELYASQVQQNAIAAAGLKQQLEATREASRSLREIANEVARQSTVFTEKSSSAAYQFFDTAGEEIAELTVQLRGLVEQIRHTGAGGQAVGSAARSTNQTRV
jgi:archaellum component FlaC